MKWFITLLALVSLNVHAEKDWNHGTTNNSNAYSGSYSKASGGNSSAVSGGSTISVEGSDDENHFFSFATTFPQAHGCLGGAQGGASGSSGGGGFFGMHFINHDCWTSALAEAEANIDVRSRLKCAGKHFRNAIAFEQTENKQRYCVDYMVGKYRAELEAARAAVEEALDEGELEPVSVIPVPIVLAGNVTQEEFEEQAKQVEDKNAQQQNQIEALERRTREAEARAAQAEQALQQMQQKQLSKKEALQQLQQQVQQDYVKQ